MDTDYLANYYFQKNDPTFQIPTIIRQKNDDVIKSFNTIKVEITMKQTKAILKEQFRTSVPESL